jgi:hypothetical protein
MDTGVDIRAERLRVGLALFEGWPYVEPRESPAALSPEELVIAQDVDERDMELLNACVDVERQLRDQAFRAIERLAVEVAGKRGRLDDRIRALPPSEARQRAVRELDGAGWLFPAPSEAGS